MASLLFRFIPFFSDLFLSFPCIPWSCPLQTTEYTEGKEQNGKKIPADELSFPISVEIASHYGHAAITKGAGHK